MSEFVNNFDQTTSTLSFQLPNGGQRDFCNESAVNADDISGELLTSDSTPNFSDGISSTSPVNSSKSLKASKKVKFSECDQFYETFYQTPFVNEDDEIIEDTIHVDIESMISGDDCSSSHVSFSTLDKATAGSAFDTESFSDFPLRLSQVESEGPDRFSMDLVIQKLMNFQISLQPKSGGATPREDIEKASVQFEPSADIIDDDDDVLVDRRQVSDENEMMLELIRAASQSLIECFKPNRQIPDADAEKKLREECMQMLLDGDDSDVNTPAATDVVSVGVTENNSSSSKLEGDVSRNILDNGKQSAEKNDSGSVSTTIVEGVVTKVPVHDCATVTIREPVSRPETLPERDEEISTAKISPNFIKSTSVLPDERCQPTQLARSGAASNGIALNFVAVPSMVTDYHTGPSVVKDIAACVDNPQHFPKGHGSDVIKFDGKNKPIPYPPSPNLSESETAVTRSSVEAKSSAPISPVSAMSPVNAMSSSALKARGFLGVKLAGKSSEDTSASPGSKLDYNSFSVDEAAALWVQEDASTKVDYANRRSKVTPNMSENSFKESSSATTNPCDSRRPSLNVTGAPMETELDPNCLRIKPSRLAIPMPDSPPQQALTGAHFRRHERLNRHESVAIDMAKGVERYRRWKLFGNVLFLWLLLPVIFCVLVYGIIPYDYIAGRASSSSSSNSAAAANEPEGSRLLEGESPGDQISFSAWAPSAVPWILIMASASAIAVEIYSTVISEIEFGVVIWDDSPADYFKVAASAIFFTVAMQILSFFTWGVGHVRNWLAMVAVGSTVVGFLLYRMFYRKRSASTISPESCEAFRRFLRGLFVLFLLTGVLYTTFTILYSQFSTTSGGFVGFLLAVSFPLLRIILIAAMERIPCVLWGHNGRGLCAGSTYVIVLAMWHGVFLSLIAACVSSSFELMTLGAVEISLQFSTLYTISKLPSSSLLKTQSSEAIDKSGPKVAGSRYRKERELLSRGCKARKVVAIHPNNDIESPRNNLAREGLVISVPGETAPDPTDPVNTGKDPAAPTVDIVNEGNNLPTESLDRCPSSFSLDAGPVVTGPRNIKGGGRAPTPGDEAHETRLATLLGLTWLTGSLTPLAFLVCATLLNVGPNRRLFSAKVNIWRSAGGPIFSEVSDIEVVAGMSRMWSLSIFNRETSDVETVMWSIPSLGTGVGSALVAKMLCVSFAHVIMLVGGCLWLRWNGNGSGNATGTVKGTISSRSPIGLSRDAFEDSDCANSSRASKDLGGLMSALLEYQYNIVALSSVMTTAIIFSVVFPWYGMNSSF
jgi:hypothetical protein